MGKISKTFALFLTLIVTMSCLTVPMVKPASAQSVPEPSVPEFTLKFVDKSYDTPSTTTSTTNPNNDKTTSTTIPSQHVQNYTIELVITNQAFPTTINGNTSDLHYNVRTKSHFEENWKDPSHADSWKDLYHFYDSGIYNVPASDSQYTVAYFPANGYNFGDEIDFQVKAILGYYYAYFPDPSIPIPSTDFISAESEWSPTQTFTMPVKSPTPSSQPSNTLILSFAIIVAVAVIVIITVLLLHRRHRKQLNFLKAHS